MTPAGPNDVAGVEIERSDPEAHHVRGAKVSDDAAVDERLHEGIGVREAQRYLRAPLERAPGAHQIELRTAPLDFPDEELGELHRLRPHVFDRHPLPGVEGGVEGGEAEYGRRAYPHAGDAGAGAVVEVEGEGGFVAEPPAEGGPHPLDVPGGDVDKGRRARGPPFRNL